MAAQKITPLGAVMVLIVLGWLWYDGAFDGLENTVQDNAETVVNGVPDLVNTGQTL